MSTPCCPSHIRTTTAFTSAWTGPAWRTWRRCCDYRDQGPERRSFRPFRRVRNVALRPTLPACVLRVGHHATRRTRRRRRFRAHGGPMEARPHHCLSYSPGLRFYSPPAEEPPGHRRAEPRIGETRHDLGEAIRYLVAGRAGFAIVGCSSRPLHSAPHVGRRRELGWRASGSGGGTCRAWTCRRLASRTHRGALHRRCAGRLEDRALGGVPPAGGRCCPTSAAAGCGWP